MWNHFLARYRSPIMALALCAGVVFGGSLPEVGNLAQYYLFHKVPYSEDPNHYFNGYFIVVGVLGIVICGLALYRRLLQASAHDVVKEKGNNT